MRAVVNQTHLRLAAVIDRCQMPVAEVSRLDVGSLLPLSDVTLDDVVLEVKTAGEARVLGRGRLGTFRRNKAVRLNGSLDRSFLDPLADVLGAARSSSDAGDIIADHEKDLRKDSAGKETSAEAAEEREE